MTARTSSAHDGGVSAVRPLPESGSIYLDARGHERALRVSWHTDTDLVVLSLWRDNVCTGSFRLSIDEVPDLIQVLRDGLADAYDQARDRLHAVDSA